MVDVRANGGIIFGAGTTREDGKVYEVYIDGEIGDEIPVEYIYKIYNDKSTAKETVNTPKSKKQKISKVKPMINTNSIAQYIKDEAEFKIIENIDKDKYSSYNDWLKFIWAIKFSFGKEALDIANYFSYGHE